MSAFPAPRRLSSTAPAPNFQPKTFPLASFFMGATTGSHPSNTFVKFSKNYRRKKGNKCELIDFEGAGHTFFNYNTNEQLYELSLNALDRFLVDLNFLSPEEPLVF